MDEEWTLFDDDYGYSQFIWKDKIVFAPFTSAVAVVAA